MHDNFKDSLRDSFIELLDSKRGVQAKLAKSIGKKQSYFSEVKRGSPVNAMHLKAIGIVFGYEKVCELLGIPIINTTPTIKVENSNQEIPPNNPAHSEIVNYFKQKDLAKEINWNLIRLENVDPESLKEIDEFIKFKLKLKGETPDENFALPGHQPSKQKNGTSG